MDARTIPALLLLALAAASATAAPQDPPSPPEDDAVERLTQGLLLYETLEREEIQQLIQGAHPEGLREKTAEELREERLSKKATPPPRPEPELGGEGGSLSGLSPA